MSGPAHVTRSANNPSVADGTTITDLEVDGRLPAALSGRYVCIGDRIDGISLHAVSLGAGRAISYRNRSIRTDDVVATNLIAFGQSILAVGDGALAYEIDARLDTIRRVDLAGARRSLVADCTVDRHTGELHLLTFASIGSQLHVVVSRGALTRTIRSIDDAPSLIRQLEPTREDVVLVGDGFIGVSARAGVDPRPTWFEIDTTGRHLAGAHVCRETVVAYATGPSLVRWTLDRRTATPHAEVLDPAIHTFATSNSWQPASARRFLWTVGAGTAHKHDLFAGGRRSHDFGEGRTPGELVFVADPGRSSTEDGGWLVGFVHDDHATDQAELVVLDAEFIERPALATVLIPRRVPAGTRGTWI